MVVHLVVIEFSFFRNRYSCYIGKLSQFKFITGYNNIKGILVISERGIGYLAKASNPEKFNHLGPVSLLASLMFFLRYLKVMYEQLLEYLFGNE